MFDPTTAQLVEEPVQNTTVSTAPKPTFDPSTAQLEGSTRSQQPIEAVPQEPSALEQTIGPAAYKIGEVASKAIEKVPSAGALIGGISTAAATGVEALGYGSTWLARTLGVMKPETAKQINDYIEGTASKAKVYPNAKGDVLEQSAEGDPLAYNLGKYGMGTYLAAKSMPGKLAGMSGLPGIVGRTAVNVPLGAGMAGSDYNSQNIGAALTGVLSPALDLGAKAIGAGTKALTKTPLLEKKVEDFITNTTQNLTGQTTGKLTAQSMAKRYTKAYDHAQQLYTKLKAAPLLPEFKQNTPNLLAQMEQGLKNNAATLTPAQNTVLTNITSRLTNVNNMDDAINLKKYLGKSFTKFAGQSTDEVMSVYKQVQKEIDNVIGTSATQAGLGKTWENVNKLYAKVIIPLQELKADKIAKGIKGTVTQQAEAINLAKLPLSLSDNIDSSKLKATLAGMDSSGKQIATDKIILNTVGQMFNDPEKFNYSTASQQLTSYIKKYSSVLGQKATAQLKGLQKVLLALKPSSTPGGGYTARFVTEAGLGATIGSGLGYKVAGPIGGIAGGLIGATAGPAIAHKLRKFTHSPQGLKILQGLGSGKPWLRDVVQAIKIAPASQLEEQQPVSNKLPETMPMQTLGVRN